MWFYLFIVRRVWIHFGEQTNQFRELLSFKYWYDLLRDIPFYIFWWAGVYVKKETCVNFLTDSHEGRSTLGPIDILVYEWVWGKHACVDMIKVSPLVRLGTWGFTLGQTTSKSLQLNWLNMKKYVLTINMFLYHLP